MALPCWAEAVGTASPGRHGAGICWEHTFLVSARTGASWEGQSRAGLDLAQGRALLPRLFPAIPSRVAGTSECCTHCPVSPAFLVIPPPFHPQFFFPFTVTNVHKESAMKSVLIGVILKGIFLLSGNEMCTVLAVCPACVRACPG